MVAPMGLGIGPEMASRVMPDGNLFAQPAIVTACHNSRILRIYKVLWYPGSHWSFPRPLRSRKAEATEFQRGDLSEGTRRLNGRTNTRLQPQSAHLWPFVFLPPSPLSSWKGVPKSPQENNPWNVSMCGGLSASRNLLIFSFSKPP